MKKETIQFPDLELRAGDSDEGVVEGYIAVWGTVDSYMSEFQRGSFAKTISERGNRIKLLFNHNEESVIGKVIEIREDDTGVFVRAKVTMAVQQANDVLALIKDNVIDTFSFGFRAVKQTFRSGVRVITEVKLYEVSPVVFEANENAVITGVRKDEDRSTDFDTTLSFNQLHSARYDLTSAIANTLDDIFYSFAYDEMSTAEAMSATNDALTKFSALYSDYTERLINAVGERSEALGNPIAEAMIKEFAGKSADEVASTTSLTTDEVIALRAGRVVASDNLPENIGSAIQQVRNEVVNSLCSELRSGSYNAAEMERMTGIIEQTLYPKGKDDDLIASLRKFSSNLKTTQEKI